MNDTLYITLVNYIDWSIGAADTPTSELLLTLQTSHATNIGIRHLYGK